MKQNNTVRGIPTRVLVFLAVPTGLGKNTEFIKDDADRCGWTNCAGCP